jgi:hypothetical protein
VSDFPAFGPPWLFPLPLSLSAEAGDTSAAHRMDKKAIETLRMGYFSCGAPVDDRATPLPPAWHTARVDGERAFWGHQANAKGSRSFLASVRFDQLCNDAPAQPLLLSDATVEASRSKGLPK